MKNFIISSAEEKEIRIDKWLKRNFSTLNQSFIEKNLRKGNIKVNKKKVSSNYKLKVKDLITIFNYSKEAYNHIIKSRSIKKIPSKYLKIFKSSILFENSDFIILNKWSGIATQGGSKINLSLDDIIKNISENYNLVHRLDRETSGLLIIAKNLQSTKIFGKLFKEQLITKKYFAICQGVPQNRESEVNLILQNKSKNNKKSDSITKFKIYQTKKKLTSIIFEPKTGKTHQIRIVAKHLGSPIIGDTKYNKLSNYNFEKLKLNAFLLKFKMKQKEYKFISYLPEHFKTFMSKNNLKIIDKKIIDNLF